MAGDDVRELQIDVTTLTLLLEKFAFLVAITIPFDIRDMHYDDPGQKTIPQLFGLNTARTLAIVFASISLMASASLYLSGIYGSYTLTAFALSAAVNIIFISSSDPKKSEMYFAGGVDSTLLIQTVLVGLSFLIES